MKKLVLIIALCSLHFSAFAEIRIVSDLDDTLKITNVNNWSQAVRNALFSKKLLQECLNLFTRCRVIP